MTHLSHSVHQTESIAAELAQSLTAGACLALFGDLGAGKTQFVRGLLRGLGGNPHTVSSPTFVLLNVYETGRLPLYHLDAYRIAGAEDFESIGFSELLDQGGVVVVEWADKVTPILPPIRLDIHIATLSPLRRQISIAYAGVR